jgi:hypothetical protein
MTAINGSTAAVTGGQRGLGKELAAQPLSRGATKVYATASRPHESGHARVIPVGASPDLLLGLAGELVGLVSGLVGSRSLSDIPLYAARPVRNRCHQRFRAEMAQTSRFNCIAPGNIPEREESHP